MPNRKLIAPIAVLVLLLGLAPSAVAVATPPVTQTPTVEFVANGVLRDGRVPLSLAWAKAQPGSAAVARYQLQSRSDRGSWKKVDLPAPLARSVTIYRRPGRLVQFRLRAIDEQGNAGAWAKMAEQWLGALEADDHSISFSAPWTQRTSSSAFGGLLRYSTKPGARTSLTFEATSIGWVSARGPDRGRAHVSLDEELAATVDLYRSTTQWRRIVFAQSWPSTVQGELEVVVEGTAGRPRVDLDALIFLGPPPLATLVGAGDIGKCPAGDPQATAAVVEEVEGIVFTTGDNAYSGGTAQAFANCYHPSWGRFQARTRPTPGNHDYEVKGAAPYFDYFGRAAGPRGKGWYAYDAGTWRIYALNSNCSAVGGCGSTSAQYTWLKRQLAVNPRRCVAAYWHHPLVSSGKHGNSTAMSSILRLLYTNNADLVLAGHDHTYERFAAMRPDLVADPVRGIRQFVIGTGGAPLYELGPRKPHSEMANSETLGVLKLDLSWNTYEWEFLPVAGGEFTDAGSGTCH